MRDLPRPKIGSGRAARPMVTFICKPELKSSQIPQFPNLRHRDHQSHRTKDTLRSWSSSSHFFGGMVSNYFARARDRMFATTRIYRVSVS
jgi:hypothetical protein